MEDGSVTQRLLSRIPFVRSSLEDTRPSATDGLDENGSRNTAPTLKPLQPAVRTRRRKGSLRKTALLTKGLSRQSGELYHNSTYSQEPEADGSSEALGISVGSTSNGSTAQGKGKDRKAFPSSSSLSESHTTAQQTQSQGDSKYASTTDDDNDHLVLKTRSSSMSQSLASPPTSNPSSILRRRSSKSANQPPVLSSLSHSTSVTAIDALVHPLQIHDYSETEWWGWIILITTWIVFIIGMGSCLGVWSWAWDVGETPYAPPELEDDPTLPIVGYYPALIVMTGVMAWVWVVVAWVGMKYFRHAKVWDEEDD